MKKKVLRKIRYEENINDTLPKVKKKKGGKQ